MNIQFAQFPIKIFDVRQEDSEFWGGLRAETIISFEYGVREMLTRSLLQIYLSTFTHRGNLLLHQAAPYNPPALHNKHFHSATL